MPLAVHLGGRWHPSASDALVDQAYQAVGTVLSLQLIFSWSVMHEAVLGAIQWADVDARTGGAVNADGNVVDADQFNTVGPAQQTAATMVGPSLLALQFVLAIDVLRNVYSFERGARRGEWRTGGFGACGGGAFFCGLCRGRMDGIGSFCTAPLPARVRELLAFAPQLLEHRTPRCLRLAGAAIARLQRACCASSPIAPRRLERRVAFLVRRFAAHAPRWQAVLWGRQLALMCVLVGSSVANLSLAADSSEQRLAQVGLALVALVVVLGEWCAHRRSQPYAYRYQNALESYLSLSLVVLLVLACVNMALTDAARTETASGLLVEYSMLALLAGTLVGGAMYGAYWVRATTAALRALDVDLGAILLKANERIDEPVRERLLAGDIRLLSCAWLLSAESDAALGRSERGAVILLRRQELPDEASLTPAEAVAAFNRADRSVLVLSYRWLTAAHPDPFGSTLEAVRRYLRSMPSVGECGLFWE